VGRNYVCNTEYPWPGGGLGVGRLSLGFRFWLVFTHDTRISLVLRACVSCIEAVFASLSTSDVCLDTRTEWQIQI
jgi:hypothetical protein